LAIDKIFDVYTEDIKLQLCYNVITYKFIVI